MNQSPTAAESQEESSREPAADGPAPGSGDSGHVRRPQISLVLFFVSFTLFCLWLGLVHARYIHVRVRLFAPAAIATVYFSLAFDWSARRACAGGVFAFLASAFYLNLWEGNSPEQTAASLYSGSLFFGVMLVAVTVPSYWLAERFKVRFLIPSQKSAGS